MSNESKKWVFYTEKRNTLMNDEDLKRRGFRVEAAETLGIEKKGSYFIITGTEKDIKKIEILKKEAELVNKEETERILAKIKELDESVVSGVGSLFD